MVSRHVPVAVRRELRREVNYSCAYCGTPLVQYHHIVPFHENEHHDPDRMIALCPTCHAEADAGTISREKLYELKNNPAISDLVEHEFYFESKQRMLGLGNVGVKIHDGQEGKSPVLRVDGEALIEVGYVDGVLQFVTNFHSKDGREIAQISNGEWWVSTESAWDMEYKKKTLKLWSSEENLAFAVRYDPETDQVDIVGRFHSNGKRVIVSTDYGVVVPELNFSIRDLAFSIGDGPGAVLDI
ncbi:HNH endonuclease [Haloferax volcanii]|uniref:HNH endonuclease n=1 Tax=Haloferax volcanii TaxID=2246 RepID=UPI0038529006